MGHSASKAASPRVGLFKTKKNALHKKQPRVFNGIGERDPLLPVASHSTHHHRSHASMVSADSSAANEINGSAESKALVEECKGKDLKEGLSLRAFQLMTLAGAIGTGLFLSLGGALQSGGPLGAFLGYTVVGLVVCAVQYALGEVSTLYPVNGAFVRQAEIIIDPALGFALGWNVVYGTMISVPSQITACLVLMEFWTDRYMALWITIMVAATFGFGLVGVTAFGEIESFMTIKKIFLVVSIIIMAIIIDLGWLPDTKPYGLRYWYYPGPFVEYMVSGSWGKFVGFWAVLNNAIFSFAGIEDLTIAASETQSPRQTIPKACRKVFARVVCFYLVTVLAIGLLVPSNDPALNDLSGTRTRSPFVIVATRAGYAFVSSALNAMILTTALSSANSSILSGLRVLFGLGGKGHAPSAFTHASKWGSPYRSVFLQTAVAALSYIALFNGALTVFYYFVDMTAAETLVNWIVVLLNHIRLRLALRKQGIPYTDLPWHHWWTPYSSYVGLVACFLFLLTGGFTVFFEGYWDTGTFISAYIDIPLVILLYLGWKYWMGTSIVPLDKIPLRDILDDIKGHPENALPSPRGWEKFNIFWG